MSQFLLRAAATALLLLAAFLLAPGSRVAAAGTSPLDAVPLENQRFAGTGTLTAGQSHWFRVEYPGNGQPLGITLQILNGVSVDSVVAAVNVRSRPELASADPDADWRGFSRIGVLTPTSDSGPDRSFWLNTSGQGETYFLRIVNHSGQTVRFALIVERSERPGSIIPPGTGLPNLTSQLSSPSDGTTPAPTTLATPAKPEIIDSGIDTIFPIGAGGLEPTITAGASPRTAVWLQNHDILAGGTIGPGESYWWKLHHPGSGIPIGITLQYRGNSPEAGEPPLHGTISLFSPDGDIIGDVDADWVGFTRVGVLEQLGDGPGRRFWVSTSTEPQVYYFRIFNVSGERVPFALAVQQSEIPTPLDGVLGAAVSGVLRAPQSPILQPDAGQTR